MVYLVCLVLLVYLVKGEGLSRRAAARRRTVTGNPWSVTSGTKEGIRESGFRIRDGEP